MENKEVIRKYVTLDTVIEMMKDIIGLSIEPTFSLEDMTDGDKLTIIYMLTLAAIHIKNNWEAFGRINIEKDDQVYCITLGVNGISINELMDELKEMDKIKPFNDE